MDTLPSGIVTFMFTDVEGSTRLFQQHPDAMPAALARHHVLLKDAIDLHHGWVFNIVGDAFCSVFERADDAVAAALRAQRELHREPWSAIGALQVRIGLHTGAAELKDGEYASSLTLARAHRVMNAGHGGQTLLSAATAGRVRPTMEPGTTLRVLGEHKLRGLAEAETLFQLVVADLPSEFAPLRVEDTGGAPGAPLHELVRGKLIGRAVELTHLKQHWDQAQQARGHLVLLSGEPGVGKTRLAQELIAHARQSGATILRGGCYEYEATTPYLPLVEALREWVHGQSVEQLRAKLATTAVEMAKLAPEIESKLGTLVPNASLSPGEERLRLFDNVGRLLQSLAADCGLLLFVDDIHWADQGTLSLLHYALRLLRNDRVLVLATYREVELDRTHPLAAVLVDWNRERLATRVPLGRLSHADTGALIAMLFGQETVAAEFVDALYRETEGNPFFLEEVVKSLIEQGQIYREDGGWERKEMHELANPQSVKEAIGRRLTRLTDATVDALRTAAALGKIFSFNELAAVTSGNVETLLDALDEASAAQLVRANGDDGPISSGEHDNFAFTHDKIREVLYEELNPIRQRRLHQRIGEALERLYGASAEPAPRACGTIGRSRAGPRSSFRTGGRSRARSRVLAPCGGQCRARLRTRRGAQVPGTGARVRRENAAGRGLWNEALAFAALDAQEGHKTGSVARVAWSEFCRVEALHGQGEIALAYAAALQALAMCERIGEGRLATWVEPLAAQIAADLGDDAAARSHAERGWALAQALNQLVLSAWALNGLGRAAMLRDDIDAALEWYERYLALVRDTENAIAWNLIVARAAETYLHAGRIDEAARLTERAMTFAEFGNAPHYRALAHRVQGQVFLARGQPDDALRSFDAALAEFEPLGSRLEVGRVLYHRAVLRIGHGEQAAGRADANRAHDVFTAVGAVHDRALAERLLDTGDQR